MCLLIKSVVFGLLTIQKTSSLMEYKSRTQSIEKTVWFIVQYVFFVFKYNIVSGFQVNTVRLPEPTVGRKSLR
jgi:hypothetical protein